jgi:hypothetical protein
MRCLLSSKSNNRIQSLPVAAYTERTPKMVLFSFRFGIKKINKVAMEFAT